MCPLPLALGQISVRKGTGWAESAPSTTGEWDCGVWILEWVRPTQAVCGDRHLQHLSVLPRWPQVQAWLRRATDVGCRGLSYSLCLQGFQETALSEVDLTVFLQCLDLGIFFFLTAAWIQLCRPLCAANHEVREEQCVRWRGSQCIKECKISQGSRAWMLKV